MMTTKVPLPLRCPARSPLGLRCCCVLPMCRGAGRCVALHGAACTLTRAPHGCCPDSFSTCRPIRCRGLPRPCLSAPSRTCRSPSSPSLQTGRGRFLRRRSGGSLGLLREASLKAGGGRISARLCADANREADEQRQGTSSPCEPTSVAAGRGTDRQDTRVGRCAVSCQSCCT